MLVQQALTHRAACPVLSLLLIFLVDEGLLGPEGHGRWHALNQLLLWARQSGSSSLPLTGGKKLHFVLCEMR